MGNKCYIKEMRLTLAQQAAGLRSLYPDAACYIDRNHLLWKGTLVPTPLSAAYEIKLTYAIGTSPKTYVISPRLFVPEGKSLPHMYDHIEQRICTYYPLGKPDWKPSMHIARTLVPWASEWLFFYELWLATGEWLGGGIHLGTKKTDAPDCTQG